MPPRSTPRFIRRIGRSLARRTVIPAVNAGALDYVIQHLPEWMTATSFDFASLRRLWVAQNPRNDWTDLVRLCMLVENVRQLEKERIPGSIAELGVYKGTTAKVLHTLLPERRLYLFDTFQGFDPEDLPPEQRGSQDMPAPFTDASLETVLDYLGSSPLVTACKGRFPATTASVPADERFALVHLDADLFQPTFEALQYFYPRLSPGGYIIVHDYSSLAWPGIVEAVDRFFADKPESVALVPDKSGTAIVRKVKRPRPSA